MAACVAGTQGSPAQAHGGSWSCVHVLLCAGLWLVQGHRHAPASCMAPQNPTLTCPGSVSSIHQLRNKVSEEHEVIKKKELETGPKASYGYGGKFGTERDRMDKVTAVEGFLEPQWKSDFLIKEGASLFSGLTLKGENGEFAWLHRFARVQLAHNLSPGSV